MSTRRVLVRVQLIDAENLGVIAQSTSQSIHLRGDLMAEPPSTHKDALQDAFCREVAAVGVTAYQNLYVWEVKP